MKNIRDLMSPNPISVTATTTVAEAASLMGAMNVGSVLVVKEEKLAGIFTERDIVKALAAHFDAAGHSVSEWMTTNPVTIAPDATDHDALDLMLAGGFRHLPVIDGERIAGVVSMRDVTHHSGGTRPEG